MKSKKVKFQYIGGIMKKLFIFTLVFAVCCLMTTSSWAAKKTDFYKSNAKDFIRSLNDNGNMGKAFGLSKGEDFVLISQRTDLNRETHSRYQQTFNGYPVWGIRTVISTKSGKVIKLHGAVVQGAPKDVGSIPKKLDALAALKEMKENHMAQDSGAVWNFENETAGTYVYFHKKSKKARLCYVVSFFADTDCGNPSQPIFMINAKNGKIIESYDMLRYAYDGTGPGGNQKIGYYYYGTDYSKFGVAVSGSTCTMNYADCRSVNLNHGTSGTTPYSYTCYENTFKEINGAYSPINDAQFFGQQIYNMYQDWYGLPVLPFQLMMRVHYSTNYENAFWNGSSMTFGDGYSTFYPLVCLDVSAHEVAHGFTENHSNLTYSGQSGGINESYSDMAGEAAKYYMRGTNDFMCGYDIFKSPSGALRYLYDPPLDGQSIDHVDDYYSGMDVHYSSGVFNKAFYLLATTSGWTTRMAFDVFTKANTDYWSASTNFVQGAEGAQDAAADLGYSCTAVRDAFNTVGITLVCAGPPLANFSGTPTSGGSPLTVNFTDLSSNDPTSWSWSFPGGTPSGSTAQNPTVTYNSPGTYDVTLTAANAQGSDGETKTNYITVTAPQPPVANFTASATSISVGQSVTFTDTSTNTPTSWSWTFAGGTPGSSTAQNPTITYNTEGTFDVTLVATNAVGSDTETKVGYINVSAIPYCNSQGNDYSYEWISRVVVAGMDNSSGAAGDNASVSLTPGFSGSTYTEYWKIWIDYNGDHDFNDAGEEVFSGVGSSTVSGSFTVASVDIVTRMRVSMKWNAAPTSCETFSYGEVEDYTVDISPAVPQPPTAAFTASATTVTVGGSVTFTDQSTNSPTSWSWTFQGGTPGSSTSQNPTVTYNTVGTFDVSLTAANSAGSDNETKIDYITVNSAPADEIAEAVDNGSLEFDHSGNANWTKVTDVYYYGGDSARSGDISDNQSSTIETEVTVGSTQAVKFYWKVSSEANYDYLRFYIDGVEQTQIAGTVDWTQVSYNISAGTHTLKWSFTKDYSVSSGSDCGWVDKLEITDPMADPIAEAVDAPSQAFTLSGNADWFSQTVTTYYGGDAAQSGDIGNNQTTTMETTISGVTSVKFYWKVSSESNYDYLRFYIDGVEMNRVSGNVNWTQRTYIVSSGSHTLKWSFTKDYSVSTGSDCGWVDKLELQ
jgi:Zn-dependent metalloprotease/plastocyanin